MSALRLEIDPEDLLQIITKLANRHWRIGPWTLIGVRFGSKADIRTIPPCDEHATATRGTMGTGRVGAAWPPAAASLAKMVQRHAVTG